MTDKKDPSKSEGSSGASQATDIIPFPPTSDSGPPYTHRLMPGFDPDNPMGITIDTIPPTQIREAGQGGLDTPEDTAKPSHNQADNFNVRSVR